MSGHAAIGSFLHDRITGPQCLESDECWWCNCGRRQSRFHLFVECRAWAPQIRKLWKRVGKDCGREHPRAPALRRLWKDDAVGVVVDFLEVFGASRGPMPSADGPGHPRIIHLIQNRLPCIAKNAS